MRKSLYVNGEKYHPTLISYHREHREQKNTPRTQSKDFCCLKPTPTPKTYSHTKSQRSQSHTQPRKFILLFINPNPQIQNPNITTENTEKNRITEQRS